MSSQDLSVRTRPFLTEPTAIPEPRSRKLANTGQPRLANSRVRTDYCMTMTTCQAKLLLWLCITARGEMAFGEGT
jgi:hypothetical protein